MALWKARSLSPEQKALLAEESDAGSIGSEESESFLDMEDVKMSEVYSSSLPMSVSLAILSGQIFEVTCNDLYSVRLADLQYILFKR